MLEVVNLYFGFMMGDNYQGLHKTLGDSLSDSSTTSLRQAAFVAKLPKFMQWVLHKLGAAYLELPIPREFPFNKHTSINAFSGGILYS